MSQDPSVRYRRVLASGAPVRGEHRRVAHCGAGSFVDSAACVLAYLSLSSILPLHLLLFDVGSWALQHVDYCTKLKELLLVVDLDAPTTI